MELFSIRIQRTFQLVSTIFVVVMLYGRAHGPAHTVEHLMVISDF